LVRGVEEDGPAGKAGVREGDLITAVGGTALTDADELHAALDAVGKDGTLALSILRGTEELQISVTFA
ncbi:MAG: PDZ domain-containing protein, partial [Actinomycetota bacterium]